MFSSTGESWVQDRQQPSRGHTGGEHQTACWGEVSSLLRSHYGDIYRVTAVFPWLAWPAMRVGPYSYACYCYRNRTFIVGNRFWSPLSTCHWQGEIWGEAPPPQHNCSLPIRWRQCKASTENTYFSKALFSSLSASFFCQALCFLTRVSHKALTTEMSNTTTLCPILEAWNYLFKKHICQLHTHREENSFNLNFKIWVNQFYH